MAKEVILDWAEYVKTAREIIAEGCVLLENRDGALPLADGTKVALFGRIQNHYYKSGTGSGGMVNVSKVIGIREALTECGKLHVNRELLDIYAAWEEEHPYDEGLGWGNEPWSQVEMPLDEELVKKTAAESDTAIVIIGRTAGEDKDSAATPGSYLLTEGEEEMLRLVRENFEHMIVLLNVASIMDLSMIDAYKPEAIMIVWVGGMVGGLGVVDLLTGDATPSGHLCDTVSFEVEDHASDRNFGNPDKDYYQEDIYVGYRYFETFAPELVRYPFGYGLSYTTFDLQKTQSPVCGNLAEVAGKSWEDAECVTLSMTATNTGSYSGKEVVQFYVEAPQGKLGKASRSLVGFAKTQLLAPGASETVTVSAPVRDFASYDDAGVTGFRSAFVLEAGEYKFYAGENVRDAEYIGSLSLDETLVIEQLYEALAPVEPFERLRPSADMTEAFEPVPVCTKDMDERRAEEIPEEITAENATDEAEKIVATMTDEELTCIIRGEGMGSSRVTAGTASAFAGVSDALTKRVGLPAVCCSDGPSGIRLDCGIKAFSLPGGTMQAATFNPDLIKKLYSFTGLEMVATRVECLLGPGINIHRHPLNGRNFEYFSEDPLVTGVMAEAVVAGLQSSGVTGVLKHFACNNQEFHRYNVDAVVSERALREIYLKAFEKVIRDGYGDSVMTTYGVLNGLWTAGSYDLNTTILRKQWGFKGIVMTDWWANINERGKPESKTNFGAMVRAQNDLYMVCPDGGSNASGDNIEESYRTGRVTKSELQRSAANIIRFTLGTEAMKRLRGEETKVIMQNRPEEDMDVRMEDVEFIVMEGDMTVPLDTKDSKGGTSYILPFDIRKNGTYEVTVVGSSALGELAQLPVTLFFMSYPLASFTFQGTNGEMAEIKREIPFMERFSVMRLYVARNGLKLKEIRFRFLEEGGHMTHQQ